MNKRLQMGESIDVDLGLHQTPRWLPIHVLKCTLHILKRDAKTSDLAVAATDILISAFALHCVGFPGVAVAFDKFAIELYDLAGWTKKMIGLEYYQADRRMFGLQVKARLEPGVDIEELQQDAMLYAGRAYVCLSKMKKDFGQDFLDKTMKCLFDEERTWAAIVNDLVTIESG